MASSISGYDPYFPRDTVERGRMGFAGADERAASIRSSKRSTKKNIARAENQAALDRARIARETAEAVEKMQQEGANKRTSDELAAKKGVFDAQADFYSSGAKEKDIEVEAGRYLLDRRKKAQEEGKVVDEAGNIAPEIDLVAEAEKVTETEDYYRLLEDSKKKRSGMDAVREAAKEGILPFKDFFNRARGLI